MLAEGGVRGGVAGVEGQHPTVRGFGLREAPLLGQHLPQIAVGPEVVGLALEWPP